MKRTLSSAVGLLVLVGTTFGQIGWENSGDEPKRLVVNGGLGASIGFFDDGDYDGLGPLMTLASFRLGADAALVYKFNDVIALGPQVGFSALTVDLNGGSYTFFEVPLRAVMKVGRPDLAIQPFLGYYLSLGFPFPGPEVGARAILGPFFGEGSLVLSRPSWKRVALGASLNELLRF